MNTTSFDASKRVLEVQGLSVDFGSLSKPVAPKPQPAEPTPRPAPTPRPRVAGNTALAIDDDDWSTF